MIVDYTFTMEKRNKELVLIGVGLLCVGALCLIFGDQLKSPVAVKFGKVTAAVGIVLYFFGRLGPWRRK